VRPVDLPHFTITTIHPTYCTGRFDPSPWIGNDWIAGLYLGAGRFLWGRLRDVDLVARTCSFYPDQAAEMSALSPGSSLPCMDRYWGQRAELVLDEGRRWQRTQFEPVDALRFSAQGKLLGTRLPSGITPERDEVVPGGWDHEHCLICMKTIGAGGEPEGFFSEPDCWVCEACYMAYVVPRSLDFVSGV
jgi:hypothetical protein